MRRLQRILKSARRFSSTAKGRHHLACISGSGIGGIVFTWMLTAGTWNLFQWQKMGSFYDAQAHSLLNGHWDVPQQVLGIESFTVAGKSHLYQGPIPALLRMPILIFGDQLDGRLTQLSMLAAYVVTMAVLCHLSWRVRSLLRPDKPTTNKEMIGIGLFMALLGGGSSLLYLASRAWVYHEALMWGVALSLAATDALLGYLIMPSKKRLALLSLLTTAALLTRTSIGLGPLVGLGLVCLRGLLQARPWRLLPRHPLKLFTSSWTLLSAPLVAPVCYATINYVKFKTLFSVPFSAQGITIVDPIRQQMLAANNGTLFGLQFIPTTLWHYVDPTALGLSRRFPFIDFPPIPGRVFGHVQFDLIDRTSSMPASLPVLSVLAVIGVLVVLRTKPSGSGRPTLRSTRIPLLAAGAGAIAILPFGYIAQRYLADFFPFLALGSLVGFHYLATQGRRHFRYGAAFIAMLGLLTFAVNMSLALVFQRAFSPNVPQSRVAGLVGFQIEVDSWLGGRIGGFRAPSVQTHDILPGRASSGMLVIVGDCEGLYLNNGMPVDAINRTPWVAVERTPNTGLAQATVRFGPRSPGTKEEVATFKDGHKQASIYAMHVDSGHLRFGLASSNHFGLATEGLAVPVKWGSDYNLEVVADPRLGSLIVRLDDLIVLETFYWHEGDPVSFPQRFSEKTVRATLCPKVRSAAGLD